MIYELTDIEKKCLKVFKYIVGVDETNVCAYWGEIVVVGVLIDKNIKYPVNDSKLLTDKQIEEKAEWLMSHIKYAVEYVTPKECDNDMLKNEYKAIKRIINKLGNKGFVFIDFHSLPDRFHLPQWGYKDADRKLWAVASASIIAKYIWNKKCEWYHNLYPEYNLIHNRGSFGNQLFNLTVEYGLTKYHRWNWIKSACKKKGVNFDGIKRR